MNECTRHAYFGDVSTETDTILVPRFTHQKISQSKTQSKRDHNIKYCKLHTSTTLIFITMYFQTLIVAALTLAAPSLAQAEVKEDDVGKPST